MGIGLSATPLYFNKGNMKEDVLKLRMVGENENTILDDHNLIISPKFAYHILPLIIVIIMINLMLILFTAELYFVFIIIAFIFVNFSFLYILSKKLKVLHVDYSNRYIKMYYSGINNKQLNIRVKSHYTKFDELREYCVGHSIQGLWLGWYVYGKTSDGIGVPLYFSNNKKYIFQLRDLLIKYNQPLKPNAVVGFGELVKFGSAVIV